MANRFYPFKLIPLPWDPSSLPNFMSSQNIKIHHEIFYKKYIDNMNEYAETFPELKDIELSVIVSQYNGKIYNTAAQILNHEYFWKCLSPVTTAPSDRIFRYISNNFGSFEQFQERFNQRVIDHFASGWVWLVHDPQSSLLLIIDGSDAYNPITEGYIPLLVLDVWEHSYYLDYTNDKKSYVTNFWQYINWPYVEAVAREQIFTS